MSDPVIDPEYFVHLERLEERFRLMFDDPDRFYQLVLDGLAFRNASDADQRVSLLKSYLISPEIVEALLLHDGRMLPAASSYAWKRLADDGIVYDAMGTSESYANYILNIKRLLIHLRSDTFQNIFYPPANLALRYAEAIVEVNVKNKHGDDDRGTGFIAKLVPDGLEYFVTCKHNVDPNDGIELEKIQTSSGSDIKIGDIRLSKKWDIAFALIQSAPANPPFFFNDQAQMFDEVFTLGYPRVPCAEAALLGHRGEINGQASFYLAQQCPIFVISNLVAPGNSGCPVLNLNGQCIGMTTHWMEEKPRENNRPATPFSAAITASAIMSEILEVTG